MAQRGKSMIWYATKRV